MVDIAGRDIDRLAQMAPSKFVEELCDHWPGVYEHLYSQGFQTQTAMIAEMKRQSSQGGRSKAHCRTRPKMRIGVEAAAQNDS